jgi:hypothetical protein
MTEVLRTADMRSYLMATGWQPRPDTWRGASLWDHPDGYGALVPARDGMSDAPERSWEFLQVLEKVEGRPALEIAEDVASPMVDTQSIRTFPQDEPTGYVSLAAGVRALEGIRSLSRQPPKTGRRTPGSRAVGSDQARQLHLHHPAPAGTGRRTGHAGRRKLAAAA